MACKRIVARLDIKGPNLIKGIHLEGLRVMGDPNEFAKMYYDHGIDELLYMDIVASLYQRNQLHDTIRRAADQIFVPITVGGGVRSLADARALLQCGADKVAVNTAATKRPEILTEISQTFGAQACVLSIEAKRNKTGKWEAYTDNGREHTGLDVVEWAKRGQDLGAGEILLTSVDQEGTRKGLDIELLKEVRRAVSIPVIASGGVGSFAHLVEGFLSGGADAVAIADSLHYRRFSVEDFRAGAQREGVLVRKVRS